MQLQQIAERCQQGDREAFGLLYTAMRQPLRAVCMSYVHDEAVADDLLHDAFLLAFFHIGNLKDTDRTEAWMTTVMRRVSLLYLRKQRQQRQEPLSSYVASSLQSPTVENSAASSLAVQEILAAVDALPEGYRNVFRLFVLEGMTHQEIAALLNIESHSSSSQLVHAKVLLRRWLRQIGLVLLAVALPLGQEHVPMTQKPSVITFADTTQVVAKVAAASGHSASVASGDSVQTRESTPIIMTDEQTKDTTSNRIDDAQAKEPAPTNTISEGLAQGAVPKGNTHDWTLAVTYSGVSNSGELRLPYANRDTNPMVYDSVAHHRMPLTVSLMLNRKLGHHWQVGAGLCYQRMTSDMLSGNTYVALSQHQVVQYIGLPVSASWHYPLSSQLSTYFSASASVSLPLRSTLESAYLMDGQAYEPTTERLHPAVQWSAGIGIGLQYNLTPHIGIFAEPGLHYHFNSSDNNVKTWNTEHPFALEVPLGLRINF